jgi:hypothetical protein
VDLLEYRKCYQTEQADALNRHPEKCQTENRKENPKENRKEKLEEDRNSASFPRQCGEAKLTTDPQ